MANIKAITFDLWDTLVIDDSDESRRAAAGLRCKKDERRHVLWKALHQQAPIEESTVRLAYDVADAAFNHVWHDQHVTWRIDERLQVILQGLDRTLPPQVFEPVVMAHEMMEVDVPPELINGCADALAALSQRFRLAVVSDAIVTPGRRLRQILANHGIADCFGGYAFSDEVGHSKPHSSMFSAAAAQLGVQLPEMLHIGDRDHNDVRGAHAAGMKAILFTASRDVDAHRTQADAICGSYAELLGVVEQLTGG